MYRNFKQRIQIRLLFRDLISLHYVMSKKNLCSTVRGTVPFASLNKICLSFNLFKNECRFLPGRERVNCGDAVCLHFLYIFLVEGQKNSCSSFEASRLWKASTSCAVPERKIVDFNAASHSIFSFSCISCYLVS